LPTGGSNSRFDVCRAPIEGRSSAAGANGAYGWGDLRNGAGYFGDPSGAMGGVTAGYNYQIGQFVTGLEGDFDFGDVSKKETFNADGSFGKLDMQEFATVRARFGVALDRALLYVTGGYADGEIHGALFDALAPAYASGNTWQSGYAIGAGLEYAFTNNVSVKAEYLFSQLGEKTLSTPDYTAKPGQDISMIRAGVNYRF
jgi:outer membrane immunogenic protein